MVGRRGGRGRIHESEGRVGLREVGVAEVVGARRRRRRRRRRRKKVVVVWLRWYLKTKVVAQLVMAVAAKVFLVSVAVVVAVVVTVTVTVVVTVPVVVVVVVPVSSVGLCLLGCEEGSLAWVERIAEVVAVAEGQFRW